MHTWTAVLGLAVLAPSPLARAGRAPEAPLPEVVTVRVCDRGLFEASLLEQARSEADRIFARSGVAIQWAPCPGLEEAPTPEGTPQGPRDVALWVLEAHENARRSGGRPVAGWVRHSMLYADSGVIFVDRDQVLDVARRAGTRPRYVLGAVLAHEIGHVLLPEGHSGFGIMRKQLDGRAWLAAEKGQLAFGPGQLSKLRREARRASDPDGVHASGASSSALSAPAALQ